MTGLSILGTFFGSSTLTLIDANLENIELYPIYGEAIGIIRLENSEIILQSSNISNVFMNNKGAVIFANLAYMTINELNMINVISVPQVSILFFLSNAEVEITNSQFNGCSNLLRYTDSTVYLTNIIISDMIRVNGHIILIAAFYTNSYLTNLTFYGNGTSA